MDFALGAMNLILTSTAVGGSVMTLPDSVVEADEMFLLSLTVEDPLVSVAGGPATVTITDNTSESLLTEYLLSLDLLIPSLPPSLPPSQLWLFSSTSPHINCLKEQQQ